MQIPDGCTFDGRRWAIDDWQGNQGCVPGNEDLGIETISPATNNWAGRVDHFAVVQGRLYLFKVEASLAPDIDRARIGGRRREVLIRYEPLHGAAARPIQEGNPGCNDRQQGLQASQTRRVRAGPGFSGAARYAAPTNGRSSAIGRVRRPR